MNASAASASCAGDDRQRFRRLVAAHFAARIGVEEERSLRTHLPECPACRRLYNRALLLARTDPRGRTVRERLAQGLGLMGAVRPRGWRLSWAPSWAAPVLASLAAVVIVLIVRAPRTTEAPPTARGAVQAAAPALLAYRIQPGGAPRPVDSAIGVHDELGFAYSNPGGWPYLMIFAVDDHAQVYWYHPVWRIGAPPPAAIRARAGAGPFELPSATRHAFEGRRLVVYAVFTREPLGVEVIERAARRANAPDRLALPDELPIVRRTLEVTP